MSKRFLSIILAAIAIAGGGLAVNHFRAGAESNRPVDPRLVSANTDFGVRLLKELVKAEKGKNVFISPASLSMALSMTYNGADGNTKDAMAKTLGVQAMTLDQLNEANEALLANLRGQGSGVEVQVANSIWARNDIPFKDSFLDTNRRYYSAEVTSIPFDSAGLNKINSWVSDNTGGKIPDIIDHFDPEEVMALVNAVYFAGEWQKAFDPKDTKNAPFTLSGGKKIMVPMMTETPQVRRFIVPGAGKSEWPAPLVDCVGISYKNGRTELWIVIPPEGGLRSLVSGLTAAQMESWIAGSTKEKAMLFIPRFKLACSYEKQVKSALCNMGMGVAFDPVRADFSRLASLPTWIGRIVHKTVLQVDEKGTVAAAATGVMKTCGVELAMPFCIDHPFLCFIRDNKTKAILFIGVVEDPR